MDRPRNTEFRSLKKRVGILGGGQLGKMLAEAARALDLSPILFEALPNSPAAASCDEVFAADPRAFLASVEVVAFENEWIDSAPWHEAARGLSTRFAPPLATIESLRDKLTQKEVLSQLGIPAPEFIALAPGQSANVHLFLEAAWKKFGERLVLKWARQGYDGHGVFLADFAQKGEDEAAEIFIRRALDRGVPVYAEERVNFRRELAIVGLRSSTGEFAAYPLVISEQRGGICYRVTGPADAPGLEAEARGFAKKLADDQNIEGAFAIELFETPEGGLLVNEIAPRVHNSGHFTQDACPASQFENHWRALTGLELGSTVARAPFAMLNLLGPEGVPAARSSLALPPPPPSPPLFLHWYGKHEVRPRRKMGHVNAVTAVGDSPTDLSELLRKLDAYRENWANRLRGESPK